MIRANQCTAAQPALTASSASWWLFHHADKAMQAKLARDARMAKFHGMRALCMMTAIRTGLAK